jgi:putative transposase
VSGGILKPLLKYASHHGTITPQKIWAAGRRQQKKVKARSILCYWAVREAGISLRILAERLRMSAPGAGYAVERGEAIVQESHYELAQ